METIEKRSSKETAKAVAKTISEIRKVIEALPILKKYDFFIQSKFFNEGADKLISDICQENGVNEKHIRTVAGFDSKSGL
jgi:cell fate (sporulation/competence/biofilm development) regulator YmcA (YheA/YmcA/DUF963 family)